MSDPLSGGFGKFVPGFEFLQGLAKQAGNGVAGAIPQMPNLGNWVAPTLNVEELEKRIEELKAVQFWLDQNAMALKATIQALEVQKMTLATLKGMNFNMADVANAFKIKAADTLAESMQKVASTAQDMSGLNRSVLTGQQRSAPATKRRTPTKTAATSTANAATNAAPGLVDPAAWWGALTQQFQQIAVNAVKDVSKQAAAGATQGVAQGIVKGATAAATGMAGAMTSAVTGAIKKAGQAPAKAVTKAPVKAPARKRS
jgi:hypothetical protein